MMTNLMLVAAVTLLSPAFQARAQTSTQETGAAKAKIELEGALVAKAIATRDFAVLSTFWSPLLVVNNPANLIVGREQIFDSMRHGGLNDTSLTSAPDLFVLTDGTAIRMLHENVVMAAGPMAGKPLVRRATEIYQQAGDKWLLIARQATYIGFDGAILSGFVPTAYTAPPSTAETSAIRTRIEANNQAVGHAIGTMDFAALEKLWAPGMVVNSPGNNILTREQVFTAMREDKLRYASARTVPEAFFVSKDIAIEMGHDDVVLANGPMAAKPLTRRFTNVWKKTGESWVQIARQATYVGLDGGAVYGHPDPTLHQ